MEGKILIVADDRGTRELLIRSLPQDELRIFTASDGRNALLQFGLVQPDLIVLDLSLPDLDGWETLRRLRELSNVPVIVLTSPEEESRLESLRCGADCTMARPVGTREFKARVQALLRRARRRTQAGEQPQTAWSPPPTF